MRSPTRRVVPARSNRDEATVSTVCRVSPAATYIICTNPRSGSWLLSEGLASTSLAGNPREWFNIIEEQQHRARWRMDHATDLTPSAYIDLARLDSTTSNGLSAIKLHYYQFAELGKKIAAIENCGGLTAFQAMEKLFPQAGYLFLTRRDKRRQAISYLIAAGTDEWWSIDGVTPDKRQASAAYPEFDAVAIARVEQTFVENDAKWQAYFAENAITPLVIYYEDLVSDYQGTIRSVLRWLDIADADAIHIPPTRLKRQSSAQNEDWLTRYAAQKETSDELAANPVQIGVGNPFLDRIQKDYDTIPNAWKQWIARSKCLRESDETIVQVLTQNGYSRALAIAELKFAASSPYVLGAMQAVQPLNKAASLLNLQGQLARLNENDHEIERRSDISRDEFRDRYYAANRPVIIQNLMTDWKAIRAWTPDYLKRVVGSQQVEVMTGRNRDLNYEMNSHKHRTQLCFADYIDMVYSGIVTNDYYMVANNRLLERPGAEPLLKDFTAFPEYLDPTSAGNQCFLWFGPAGTVTPLHHDTSNILIAQVMGRKRYRLVRPSEWQCVYNSTGVYSEVDCENPDLNRHPKFGDATVIDMVLEPGEVLFMPVGWWHWVRALDISMTVSFTNFVFPNLFAWE
jgi:LPS sulfotransferase NodH